jgi:hypothetical protein
MLHSLKAITKEPMQLAVGARWSSPHPGLGAVIELLGGHPPRLVDLARIGKALPSEGLPPKQAPPPLLQVEPTRSRRNKAMVQAWMLGQPGTGLGAVVEGRGCR